MQETPTFSVPLADLDYGEREIDEEIPRAWLTRALEGTEAVPRDKPGRVTVTLSKNGREVMVRGRARAYVTMPCARTLDPVDFDLDADVFLLLGPPGAAPRPAPAKRARGTQGQFGPGQPKRTAAAAAPATADPEGGKKKPPPKLSGPERRKREEDAILAEEEAARDTYDADRVTLDRFLREFLVLELPMVPLREDLRSEATPAIERPLDPAPEEGRQAQEAIDPRLAPLAAIASRLRAKKE
ncbi:MAG TPA: DUF177 domain-containing protein [Polyangiaceae bacterium]|nr:DUF177 domain-containing protein [Polyangiaceae bacterium]